MPKKLVVICGPTATGKTSLGLYLAKKFNGEIISADSRQVYKGMDIGTGKDLPVNSKFRIRNYKFGRNKVGFYKIDGMNLWGYDLIDPKEDFNVSKYVTFVSSILDEIQERNKLPFVVGGTGLYIKALTDGIATISIPPNFRLRRLLGKKSSDELFEILATMDPVKAASMNTSDKKNPRRLIRAIEVAEDQIKFKSKFKNKKGNYQILMIGLTAPKEFLESRIEKRVEDRIDKGIENEIVSLVKEGISWESQAMQSLGYRQYRQYFEGKINRENFIKNWLAEEIKYAKRQLTWFKKDKRINWFDITERMWKNDVDNLINRWYSIKE